MARARLYGNAGKLSPAGPPGTFACLSGLSVFFFFCSHKTDSCRVSIIIDFFSLFYELKLQHVHHFVNRYLRSLDYYISNHSLSLQVNFSYIILK